MSPGLTADNDATGKPEGEPSEREKLSNADAAVNKESSQIASACSCASMLKSSVATMAEWRWWMATICFWRQSLRAFTLRFNSVALFSSARSFMNCSSMRANAAAKTTKSHTQPKVTYSPQQSDSMETLHSFLRAQHKAHGRMARVLKRLMECNKQARQTEAFSDNEVWIQGIVRLGIRLGIFGVKSFGGES